MIEFNHPIFGAFAMDDSYIKRLQEEKPKYHFQAMFPVQIQRPESVVRMETSCADNSLEGSEPWIVHFDDLGHMSVSGKFEAYFTDRATLRAFYMQTRRTKARKKHRRTLRTIAQQLAMFGHDEQARRVMKKARNG